MLPGFALIVVFLAKLWVSGFLDRLQSNDNLVLLSRKLLFVPVAPFCVGRPLWAVPLRSHLFLFPPFENARIAIPHTQRTREQ